MTKIHKKFTIFFTFVFIFTFFSRAFANTTDSPLNIAAEAYILVDAKTGQILFEKNSDQLMGVASISKMMTEYLVLEAVYENKITWDKKILIDDYVHKLSADTTMSNIGLTDGKTYTVKQLYDAMVIFSANAAAVALAETIAGTEGSFVTLMNDKAKQLGLINSQFVNCTGLNNSDLLGKIPAGNPTDENKMSAKDVAKLSYELIKKYPEILETSKIPKLSFEDGKEYTNFNWMLSGLIFEYEGLDGLKTGTTDNAGACFVASAKRNSNRFISVVLKAESKNSRFIETKKILDYAFATYERKVVFPKKSKIKGFSTIPVVKGKKNKVSIETSTDIEVMVNTRQSQEYELKFTKNKKLFDKNALIAADQPKNTIVGTALLANAAGETISFLNNSVTEKFLTTKVVTKSSVEKANFIVLGWRSFMSLFN